MIEDARERFLREITAHVPADRIAELHLFRPLRRGPTETGVAVIAVEQEASPTAEARLTADSGSADQPAGSTTVDAATAEPEEADPGPYAADLGPDHDAHFATHPAAGGHMRVVDTLPGADSDPDDRHSDAAPLDAASTSNGEPCALAAESAEGDDVALSGSILSGDEPRPAKRSVVRHTVFTARYRLTRKGAERGKWEFEVVADADAPLGTVDKVVRGVQRRAGEDEEPERLTAEGVRAALDGQAWQPTT